MTAIRIKKKVYLFDERFAIISDFYFKVRVLLFDAT